MAQILVIKLGALGDFVQALGPMAAIRRHHAGDRVTLLTTRPFAELARATGLFDAVEIDTRPRLLDLRGLLDLRRRLRAAHYARVYDLQTSDRSSAYFELFRPGPRPEWSGIARGASHPDADPARDRLHTVDRQNGQLAAAGIADVPPSDLGFARGVDLSTLDLPERPALLVAGGAPHRPAKRWPAPRFAELARHLLANGLTPLLVGTAEETPLAAAIAAEAPGARDLAGRTSLVELAAVACRCAVAIGNDSGPMHMSAAAGVPSIVLFSAASDPALCAPRGRVRVLRRDDLGSLPVDEVARALADVA
jgi:ADP-heptose:LPS heptosyltransferase